jgi:hypothetical protein
MDGESVSTIWSLGPLIWDANARARAERLKGIGWRPSALSRREATEAAIESALGSTNLFSCRFIMFLFAYCWDSEAARGGACILPQTVGEDRNGHCYLIWRKGTQRVKLNYQLSSSDGGQIAGLSRCIVQYPYMII